MDDNGGRALPESEGKTAYALVAQGKIPGFRVGGS